jgi:septum formation protein
MSAPQIYLASASPRRQELLRQMGIEFEVLPSNVLETRAPGEAPEVYVQRVAADKARFVAHLVATRGLPARPVLGADTEVLLDGVILGKPADAQHAAGMLRLLSGRTHQVLSGVCVIHAGITHEALSEGRVSVADLSETDISAYVATGEPLGKAGGYAIQGRGARFIERLEGSYSGVMGLPIFETSKLLQAAGIALS